MAAIGSEAVSLAGHGQVETAQETLVATAVSKEENRHYSSSDSSSNHGKLKDEGTQYAPIQGAAGHDDNALERTISQMNGGLTDEERAELRIIASLHRSRTATSNGDLERKDTLAGVTDDDARLNPEKPEFDIYIWARAFMRAMDEDGIRSARAGFAFKGLNVSGSGSALSLQKDVASILMAPFRMKEYVSLGHKPHRQILRNFDGVVKSGEMLVVLGRPGSGCSTFLKTICGELTGLSMDKGSVVHYNGIPQEHMIKEFKGEVVYNQEVDKHFPHLTVGETLEFAAAARTPHSRVKGVSRKTFIKHMTKVVMTVFGLSHTRNTKVGNEYIRGVSGGERKRVSIAEMALAGSPIACWDNSTRGLDAATALEFTRSLRISSNVAGMCHAVAIYQASQAIFDLFDKAVVLYEGREIFFGPVGVAKQYFERMGWYCPSRQTTGDFLTSVTNPQERKALQGFEQRVPRTPDEFESYWKKSSEYAALTKEISEHEVENPVGGHAIEDLRKTHHAMQAKHLRPGSPYVISVPMQIRICTVRAYQRLINDKVSTVTTIVGQIAMALVVGSVFYGAPNTTGSFFSKGATLFFAILLNALISISEINSLYDQRPIVEKQASYAFYHPWTEAMAGVMSDIPVKFMIAVCFNIILYFLAGLRTEPSQFFIFFLFVFVATLTMSSIFRSLAALTKTLSQALAFAGVMVLAIVIYTGFTLPRPYEHPWMKWISWINPIAYAFEAILVNEVHGRRFPCASFVPTAPFQSGSSFVCTVRGAVAGDLEVSGDAWAQSSYQYSYSHIWRNLGFMFAFQIFFLFVYLVATELNSSTSSSAEVLVFRRGHVPKHITDQPAQSDPEAAGGKHASDTGEKQGDSSQTDVNAIPPQKDIFTWRDVVYDISIQGEPRRLLDHVPGWVKPGTLTALMGVSGAGKTTLLDVLAQRTSMGVITGDMFVNGKPLDSSFQRKTGYVQQQDLHLETTTVREALRFSAMLRQPKFVSRKEKYDFVEEVIDMLNMRDFAEAVVGIPGEGLNVEQRKLLTIGVELAAKPALLLFLDEPTSGLDSQSSWAIVAFLRKLADHGQAVLSTIHQPSSVLFQEFDRLLFLAKGGKTVYFGDIGQNSETLLNYFESHGARHCGQAENPAEFMLEIVGAGASGKSTQDWHDVWNSSQEAKDVQTELDRIHRDKANEQVTGADSEESQREFAMPFASQLWYVTVRVFEQYWRTPSYVWGKLLLGIMSALFIGFSFYKQNSSQQGLQDIIFSVFMLTSIFSSLVQQIMPRFVTQRSLYEVRERPSKAYSWAAFLIANVFVEIPYQILLGILVFASYYYPIFGRHQSSDRQGLILLLCIQFFVFASTFAHMLIAILPDATTAGNISTLMFAMTLIFNGVMQPPTALPGFWIFMYRISPLTYLVDAIAATGMHGRAVTCAANELARFDPPVGQTCGAYLAPYLATNPGGQLVNPSATAGCEYCSLTTSDQFLASVAISWDTRWRNYGLGFAYIVFNICMAVLGYYVFRVKKWNAASFKSGPSSMLLWVRTLLGGKGRKSSGNTAKK